MSDSQKIERGDAWMKVSELRVGMWVDLDGDPYIEPEDQPIWEEEYAVIRQLDAGESTDSRWIVFETPDLSDEMVNDLHVPMDHRIKVVGRLASDVIPVILEVV